MLSCKCGKIYKTRRNYERHEKNCNHQSEKHYINLSNCCKTINTHEINIYINSVDAKQSENDMLNNIEKHVNIHLSKYLKCNSTSSFTCKYKNKKFHIVKNINWACIYTYSLNNNVLNIFRKIPDYHPIDTCPVLPITAHEASKAIQGICIFEEEGKIPGKLAAQLIDHIGNIQHIKFNSKYWIQQ